MGNGVEERDEGIDGDELSLASNGDAKSQGSLMESNYSPSAWSTVDNDADNCFSLDMLGEGDKTPVEDEKLENGGAKLSEMEMMKERFAKLLLGEDMSGSGNGVCSALAISNAITNLCATIFGQLWRLEPLSPDKKSMWRREMNWLLSVSDHIVEMVPSRQTLSDGSKLEVMTCRPRSDLFINLPALCKLDNMLLEILDSFCDTTEFWYVDQGIVPQEDSDVSPSLSQLIQHQDEKWWLPKPHVPPDGLKEITRKNLLHKRESASQILKAAMAINNAALAEMDIPDSFLDTLPKNGKATLGEFIHKCINSEHFSPEYLLDCLQLHSEHGALELANRIETSLHIWRQRLRSKHTHNSQNSSKATWNGIKELLMDGDKLELLAERAENVLICLKQRFPGLPQTTLDMSKIQCNQDVGKSILESYSRVLESIASNIVARIDGLLHVDGLVTRPDNFTSLTTVNIISHKKSVPIPSSPPPPFTSYQTGFSSRGFSSVVSPLRNQLSNTIYPANYGLNEKKSFGYHTKVRSGPNGGTFANINWEGLITSPSRPFFNGKKGGRSDLTMG